MVYKHGDAGARLPPKEDCSTYLVCDGSSIIVIIHTHILAQHLVPGTSALRMYIGILGRNNSTNIEKGLDVDDDKTSETSETPKQIINEWHVYGSSI